MSPPILMVFTKVYNLSFDPSTLLWLIWLGNVVIYHGGFDQESWRECHWFRVIAIWIWVNESGDPSTQTTWSSIANDRNIAFYITLGIPMQLKHVIYCYIMLYIYIHTVVPSVHAYTCVYTFIQTCIQQHTYLDGICRAKRCKMIP